MAHAVLKRGLRGMGFEMLGDFAKFCFFTCMDDERFDCSADDIASHIKDVLSFSKSRLFGEDPWFFFDVERFSGKR